MVEEFLHANGLNILNKGSPTYITPNTESAIDLYICSPVLQVDSQWSVLPTPRDSDHNPVIITYSSNVVEPDDVRVRNYNKANWEKYTAHEVWKTLLSDPTTTAVLIRLL